ncbi:MAG TPA: helix-turn-helix domain-containing protein [Burkholderiaceae bacterium]|nr:helix-turn-helix domain-containing protein [Burkholderiaceae bacterium]
MHTSTIENIRAFEQQIPENPYCMRSVNTGQVHPSARISAWAEALSWLTNSGSAIDFKPIGEGFVGRIDSVPVGDWRLSKVAAEGQQVLVEPRHRSAPGLPILVILQSKGCSTVSRGLQTLQVGSGQIAVVPLDEAVSLSNDRSVELVLACGTAPGGEVHPDARSLDGMRLLGGQTVTQALFSSMTQTLMSQFRTRDTAYEGFLAQTLGWLLAQAMAEPGVDADSGPGNNASRATRARIVRYIEDNLQDPALSPEQIAKAMGMSKRTLHRTFQGGEDGESIKRYIWRRRVERCAAELRNAAPSGRRPTVTEIAYSFGFSSSAHFSRRFKLQLGVTPISFRQT